MDELKAKDLKIGDTVKRKKRKVIVLTEGVVESVSDKTEVIFIKYPNYPESIPDAAWIFEKKE